MQCIVMRRDREGFDYPVANPDLCISCGKCEAVCPVLNQNQSQEPLEALAARSGVYVKGSSSGGVFPALAEQVITRGGTVYGAVLTPDLMVCHTEASDMDGIEPMRGSKYVQSELFAVFEEVKLQLEAGTEVMFTGTPCQVAGLKSYLRKDYQGLLCVDCACHGVPSPGLWEKYIRSLGAEYGMKISDVRFRTKDKGWRKYEVRISDGIKDVVRPYTKDVYMLLFLQDMTLRPSCYNCSFRSGAGVSDLTLADLWNVAQAAPEMDDDAGTSLIMVNTAKGAKAVAEADILTRKVDRELARKNNGGFSGMMEIPQRRSEFFKGYHSADNLIRYMRGYVIQESLPKRLYKLLRSVLSKIKKTMIVR